VPRSTLVRTFHHLDPHEAGHAAYGSVIDRSGFPINRAPLAAYEPCPGVSNRHKQTWLRHLDGTYAVIDVGIAPVITALWTSGVDTSFSCQGDVDAWRYVVTRELDRFIAGDVLMRMGERIVENHGDGDSWFFQLSQHPFSVARFGRSVVRTTYPCWDLP